MGLLNAPFGAAREHVPKFSPEWFIAVHATIPFVAALRKALLMPRWALALTVSSAVAGQIIGSRLERQRMRQQQAALLQPAGQPASTEPGGSSPRLSLAVSSSRWTQPHVHLQQLCGAAHSGVLGAQLQASLPTVF